LRLLEFDAVAFVGAGHLEGPGLESLELGIILPSSLWRYRNSVRWRC
jgi:hypothetical protein